MAGRKRPVRKYNNGNQEQEDLESLLVFGYECKMFKDDEKAAYIDDGQHLIPWMGDPSLLIDRYDGRGHLFDLQQYDAVNIRKSELSDEEQRMEELCDEERYLELHSDITEQVMYEEEELKRLNQAYSECHDYTSNYGAVGFSYVGEGSDEDEEDEQECSTQSNEDEEPFVVTPNLLMPVGMVPPMTEKMFTIIEKTAKFVSQQGTQMELIIKVKQADNPQFAFLEHQDVLNPFYKHLVSIMKTGKYKPKVAPERKKSFENQDYLHPKLARIMRQEPEPEIDRKGFLESVRSKLPSGQITNTVYAQLVSKLKATDSNSGRNSPTLQLPKPRPPPPVERKPAAAASSSAYSGEVGQVNYPAMPSPSSTYSQASYVDPYSESYSDPYQESYQESYSDHYQESSGPMYGPAAMSHPPPPGMEPVTLPSTPAPLPGTYSAPTQPPPPGTVPPVQEPQAALAEVKREVSPPPVYQRDYMNNEVPFHIPMPSYDIQPIIDKMAAYVAKNGPDFETIVKNKNDERFHFLESWHMHYKYYFYRKGIYKEEMPACKDTQVDSSEDTSAVEDKTGHMQAGKGGVSFSIKAKENEGSALTSNRKFMLYDSSDEEEGEGGTGSAEGIKKDPEYSTDSRTSELSQEKDEIIQEKQSNDAEDAERKLAQEKQKDKISQAAREKVASANREKQLQAERKRRAAMFLTMLKTDHPTSTSSNTSSPGPASLASSLKDENSRDAGIPSVAGSCSSSPRAKASPSQSRSPSPQPPSKVSSRSSSKAKSPARARSSPPRSNRDKNWDRTRHKDRDRDVERKRKWSPRESRSPSWRRRSPSPRIRRRHRSKTPPTAYSVVRRSKSPKKRSRTRSKSPISKVHKKKSKKSRSPSGERTYGIDRSMYMPLKVKKSKKSKSRSKSPPRSENRQTKSRSKSPSTKKSKKSKHRSKSPSNKSKESLRSSPFRSKNLLETIAEVRTPKGFPPRSLARLKHPSAPPHDDDVIIIDSPEREEPPPPPLPPLPPVETMPKPLPVDKPVNTEILSKVRAMLKATRQQVLKEDGFLDMD